MNNELSYKRLEKVLKDLGITKGDILYISSDIKTLLYKFVIEYDISTKNDRNNAINDFINIFQKVIGENGTLLFPTFSWNWCRGNGFDIRSTKGEVGTLPNWILLNREDFVRTRHPIYSFLVWGKDAKYLSNLDNQDAWSRSSPFYYLYMHKAKQLLFNIEAFQGLTFGHFVEQEVDVPYRHIKYFLGDYKDYDGKVEKRMYSMFVHDIDIEVECGIHNEWLINNKAASESNWAENKLTIVDLEKAYDLIREDLLNNEGRKTLIFNDGKLDWNNKRTVSYEIKGI